MMQRNFLPICLLLLSTGSYAYDFKAVAEQHILPAYQELVVTTAELDSTVTHYCGQHRNTNKSYLSTSYKDALLAWQGTQHLRFGPIQFLSREHRFSLWPDKRSTVSKHLARLLANPELLNKDFDISLKSVAIQGFSALERLIIDSNPVDRTQCTAMTAITRNLYSMAKELVFDWQASDDAYLAYFIKPEATNPIFESERALANQLLNALHTELEFIATQKLGRPLGKSLKKARGKRAEGWRSQTALASINKNLIASQALYQHTFANQLGGTPIRAEIDKAFTQAFADLKNITLPLAKAVADKEQRALVIKAQSSVKNIQQLVARKLAPALELAIGFNSLDGD